MQAATAGRAETSSNGGVVRLGQLANIRTGMAMAERFARMRVGDWALDVVGSTDIVKDRVALGEGLRRIEVRQSVVSEKHLLEPYDILVTARAQTVKVALVPPSVTRAVASVTLLVVRTPDPGTGLAQFLWYFLSSKQGRAEVTSRLTATSLPMLSATAIGEVPVPLPPAAELHRLANFVDAAEEWRAAALEAVRLRDVALKESLIRAITRNDTKTPDGWLEHHIGAERHARRPAPNL